MAQPNRPITKRILRTPLTLSRFVLILSLAYCSLTGWLRLSAALSGREWIEVLRLPPGPVYFIVSGAVWGLLFLVSLAGVLLQIRGAGWMTISTAVITSAWHWFERVAFAQSPLANTGWIFEAALNAALLLIIFWMMKDFPPAVSVEQSALSNPPSER